MSTHLTASEEQTVNPWWTLAVLCLSLVMVVLGNTVLNVALPTLVRELHATSTELQWMVDSYALVFAGLLLTAGALGDRFGRKGALVTGLVIFGGASFASTFATQASHIIATRAVMGLGAALVMPATLSILTTVFPPEQRAQAIAIWAGFAGAGAAIGPIAGGWLLEHFYWGSVFYLNVPVVLIALIGGRFLVPTSRDPEHANLDLVGAGLSIVGLGALLYGIIEAPTYGWSDPLTLTAFGLAAVVLGTFGWWELHNPNPMLDLRFFKDPRFSAASAAISLNFFAMFGTFFLLTQYLQVVRGYTPLGAGVRTLPMAFTMMVAAPMSARFVKRFGPKRVMSTGLAIVGLGLTLTSQVDESTPYILLAGCLVVAALGMASTMAPATASIMTSIPLRKAGVGSAWNDTTRELGGALGVAVLGSVAASVYSSRLADALPTGVTASVAEVAKTSVGAAVQISHNIPAGLGTPLEEVAKAAFVAATSEALLIAAGVVFVAAALVGRYMPALSAIPGTAPAHGTPGADQPAPARSEA
jgi:EmrB/QacA subfamily drug resistance transporter